MSKYTTNEEESQCLPNRLGLTRPGEIAEAEFEGFLLAEIMLTETLPPLVSTVNISAIYINWL